MLKYAGVERKREELGAAAAAEARKRFVKTGKRKRGLTSARLVRLLDRKSVV